MGRYFKGIRTQLCSECSATPSASASRPSRTPRCPQIVSLGGANHRPWMRRGRTSARTRRFTVSRCGAASARETERGIIECDHAGCVSCRLAKSPTVGDLDSPACHLQSPSRPPLATRRGKKCRSMAGASTVRYHPVPAHHCQMTHACRASRRKARTLKANCPGAH